MGYRNVNSGVMKKANQKVVLNTIRKNEPISRRDVAKKAGLTSATITNIVNDLLEQKYLIVKGKDTSYGGRKPILLGINAKAGYIIGLELKISEIICLLTDFKANLVNEIIVKVDFLNGKEFVINKVIETIEKIIVESNISKNVVKGIGIVSSGPYNQKKGIMLNPPNYPGWINVPIKDIIEKAVGVPVYFERETPAAALGEYWFGNAGISNSLFLINVFRVGIGGGLVINGDVYHGFKDGAGEIGHICVDINGYKCACGCYGCLEAVADGAAAVREVKKKLKDDTRALEEYNIDSLDEIDFSFVINKAQEGDSFCVEAIKKCAMYMGIAIGNVISLFSPDTIVLSGEFSNMSNIFTEEIKKLVRNRVYPKHNKEVNIYTSLLGKRNGAFGGVAVVFDQLFNK